MSNNENMRNYNQGEVHNIGTELRALKAGESEAVQTAIDNIIALHKKQTESLAQYQFGDPIYDQLNANYRVLLTAVNPALKTIASDYLYNPMDEQMAPTQPVNGTTGGRRRRHKRKTMRHHRSATKRRHHRKTGRRNRRI